jgi:2-polyprenyl-3-methyl-5-hydroxy-6-metoxy-1,4-benzoquinol methylase
MPAAGGYDSRRYALINRWNPRNLDLILDWVHPAPGERILDVGCGRGHLVKALADRGFDASGIDLNPNAASVAVAPTVRTMSATKLDFPDHSFDAVVSFHAIEHIEAIELVMSEIARVVKPGGAVLMVYPAEPIRGLYSIPTAMILYGNPFKTGKVHVHRLTPKKVAALAAGAGMIERRRAFRPWPWPEFASLLAASSA